MTFKELNKTDFFSFWGNTEELFIKTSTVGCMCMNGMHKGKTYIIGEATRVEVEPVGFYFGEGGQFDYFHSDIF